MRRVMLPAIGGGRFTLANIGTSPGAEEQAYKADAAGAEQEGAI